MTGAETKTREYDLEERTFRFAQSVRGFLKVIPKGIGNQEDGRQLIRSSGSVGANYIEANEALSKKDFLMRVKISRKEAKESRFWLRLLTLNGDHELENRRTLLIDEAQQLMNIMGAILQRSQGQYQNLEAPKSS